jgi:hypothetical protein
MALGFLPLPLFGNPPKNVTVRVAGRIRIVGYAPTVEPDPNVIRWPDALPLPLLDTHAIKPRIDMARTEMEQGAARQRRTTTVTPAEAPYSMVLNESQMAIYDAWIAHHADYGGQWFRIDLLTGIGYVEHTVRLMGNPEFKQIKRRRWHVTGTFEMLERPMLSEAELDDLIGAES